MIGYSHDCNQKLKYSSAFLKQHDRELYFYLLRNILKFARGYAHYSQATDQNQGPTGTARKAQQSSTQHVARIILPKHHR